MRCRHTRVPRARVVAGLLLRIHRSRGAARRARFRFLATRTPNRQPVPSACRQASTAFRARFRSDWQSRYEAGKRWLDRSRSPPRSQWPYRPNRRERRLGSASHKCGRLRRRWPSFQAQYLRPAPHGFGRQLRSRSTPRRQRRILRQGRRQPASCGAAAANPRQRPSLVQTAHRQEGVRSPRLRPPPKLAYTRPEPQG